MPPSERPGEETLRDHRSIRQLVGAVHTLLSGEETAAGWRDALHDRLETLKAELREHFGRETKGYLFERIPAIYPTQARRIERLAEEHSEILRRLEEGVRDIEKGLGSDDRIRAKMLALMTTIRRHEAEEDEILVSAYWDDFEEGD